MSCNACTKSYGFWTKEVGCPSCGFSFCSKCLKNTIAVPRLNDAKHKVCLTCYDRIQKQQLHSTAKLTSAVPSSSTSPLDEPIPAEEEQPLPAFVQQAQQFPPMIDSSSGSSNLDDIIKTRLQTLKQDRLSLTKPSTDADIAIRVANLKGLEYRAPGADAKLLLATDQRTDSEKVHDLVKQFMAETILDEAADPIRDIERRLAALRSGDGVASEELEPEKKNPVSEEDDDETKVKKLVSKYLDEATLPAAADATLSSEEKEFMDSIDVTKQQEELPWCTICNEDADLRYDGDLFCKTCYKEIKEDE